MIDQEAHIFQENFIDLDFKYCVNYRESQNRNIAEVLTTILRGKEYKSQWAKEITRLLPIFSFTTQIMDDIADLKEDIQCKRPSYAVGAIRENPDEFKCIEEFLNSNSGVAKITPEIFERLYPNSFSKVIS